MNRSRIEVHPLQAKRCMIHLAGLLTIGCQATSVSPILYPAGKNVEIRLICNQAFAGPERRHQAWEKTPVHWLFVTEDQVLAFFENDQTRVLPRDSKWKLVPGKYSCRN